MSRGNAKSGGGSGDKTFFGLTLGAEPKKVKALGGLLLLLLVVWFVMRDPAPEGPSTPANTTTAKNGPDPDATAPVPGAPGVRGPVRGDTQPGGPRRLGSRQAIATVREFKPSLKQDKENPIDPSKTDPTIHFGTLNKVQTVALAGGGRSLFDFGPMAPEAPKPGTPGAKPGKPAQVALIYGPAKPQPIPPPPPPPPPPPIPLKFYGFVNTAQGGDRRAFFMENEDIYIASEGELMKNRFKLVKIGVNSAVVEDIQFKNQQTLKLVDEAQASND